MAPLLAVDIAVDYPGKPGAIERATFEIGQAEIVGLAGESGAGKSTIALAILGLLGMRGGRVRGAIRFDGVDLLRLKERDLRRLRGKAMSLVMQTPTTALNPALRLGRQLREAWSLHSKAPWREARAGIGALLESMGLPADDAFLARHPDQVSVGQAQRVVIAMAVMHQPRLILADEPTSALDPASRGGILELFGSLNRHSGTAVLYISHDLGSMEGLCGRVCTLRQGRVAEMPRGTRLEASAQAEASFRHELLA